MKRKNNPLIVPASKPRNPLHKIKGTIKHNNERKQNKHKPKDSDEA